MSTRFLLCDQNSALLPSASYNILLQLGEMCVFSSANGPQF